MTDSVQLFPPGFRVTDPSGVPYSGAKIKVFDAGTSNVKAVYADQSLSTSLGSIVTCDSAGAPTSDGSAKTLIYTGTALYKVVLTTSADVVIATYDNVKGSAPAASLVSSFGTIASATTTDLGTIAATVVSVTGTTTITSFGAAPNLKRTVSFAGALTLTHNATVLVLPDAVNIITAPGDYAEFISDGAGSWSCTNYQRATSPTAVPDVLIEDQKTSGTAGGTFTSGTFVPRTLNTLVRNRGSVASLSSNQITLGAGQYFIKWTAPAFYDGGSASNRHQTKLRNITDASDTAIGTSEAVSGSATLGTQTISQGSTPVTITSAKTFELQHRIFITQSSNGFGLSAGFSVTEVYARLEIWKVG